jgi:hypothetical protein
VPSVLPNLTPTGAVLKTLIYTYGRFNPPHAGHAKLFGELDDLAEKFQASEVVIGVSRRQDQRNPLAPGRKIDYLQRWFPGRKFELDPNIPSDPIAILSRAAKDYDRLVMRIGLERLHDYSRWITAAVQSKQLTFGDLVIVSENRQGGSPSGTKLRELAGGGV